MKHIVNNQNKCQREKPQEHVVKQVTIKQHEPQKCKGLHVEKKQATKIYFTASTIVLSQLQQTNKSNKSLNKSHCDPGGN